MTSAGDVYDLSRAILADHDGYVAVLKVYMDESGIHDGSPVLTVGAYVARPHVWRDWTRLWSVRKRPVRVFHSTDCANLRGEFKGWTPVQRDAFVAQLLPVIGDANMLSFVSGIRVHDYDGVLRSYPWLERFLGTPYTACFQWVVHEIVDGFRRNGVNDRIAFFHETNQWKQEALDCFDYLKSEYYRDESLSLTFGDKSDYVPLQAADVLAYEGNKRLRDVKRPDRRAWTAINPNADKRLTRYFNTESLTSLAKGVQNSPTRYFDFLRSAAGSS